MALEGLNGHLRVFVALERLKQQAADQTRRIRATLCVQEPQTCIMLQVVCEPVHLQARAQKVVVQDDRASTCVPSCIQYRPIVTLPGSNGSQWVADRDAGEIVIGEWVSKPIRSASLASLCRRGARFLRLSRPHIEIM